MYSMLLFAGVGAVVGVAFACSKPRPKAVVALFAVCFCTFVGAFAGTLFAAILGTMVPLHDAVYEKGSLVAMRNIEGVSGTFMFGTGEFNSTTKYSFLLRVEDGSMVPHSVPADTLVHLIEDESLTNVGFWSTTIREPNPDSMLYNWALPDVSDNEVVRQEFRVPVGAVVQSFEIR